MRVAVVESKDTHDVDQEPQYGHNYKLCRLFQGYRHKQTTNGFKNDTAGNSHKQSTIGKTSQNLKVTKTKRIFAIRIDWVFQHNSSDETQGQR